MKNRKKSDDRWYSIKIQPVIQAVSKNLTGPTTRRWIVISLVVLGAEAEARENATRRLLEFCSLELVSRF
ncbi:unnamed protein product [Heterotrigona itama]|uniref:Uncharacterized protein n=1 Tax=Heterotrigona itama TaxID=395501 RepID=A0A6V7HCT4_9HYME|nr:unnamed protein product [Heterotrigona itama]